MLEKETYVIYHRFKRKLKLPDKSQIKDLVGQLDFLDERKPRSIQEEHHNVVTELYRLVHDKSSPVSKIQELLQLFEQSSTLKLPTVLAQDLFQRLCDERNFKLILSTVVEHYSLQKSIDELILLVERNPAQASSIISSIVRECSTSGQSNFAKMFLSQLGEDTNKWRGLAALEIAIPKANDKHSLLALWERMKKYGANDAGKGLVFDRLLGLGHQHEATLFLQANPYDFWNTAPLFDMLAQSIQERNDVEAALKLLVLFQGLQSPFKVDHIAQLSTKTSNEDVLIRLWEIALPADTFTQSAVDTFVLVALKIGQTGALISILRRTPISPSKAVFTSVLLSFWKNNDHDNLRIADEQILELFDHLGEQVLYQGIENAILVLEMDSKTGRQRSLPPDILNCLLKWIACFPKTALPYQMERILVRQIIRQEDEIATRFLKMRHTSPTAIRALTNHHLRVRRLRYSKENATDDEKSLFNLQDKYYIGVDFFIEAINAMRARSKKRSDVDAIIAQIVTSLLMLPSPLDAAIVLNSVARDDWQPPRHLLRNMVTILIRKNSFRSAQKLLRLNLHKGGYALLWTRFFARSAVLDPHRAFMCYQIYRQKREPTYSMLKCLAIGWSTTPLLTANIAVRRIEYVLQELKRLSISTSPAIARAVAYATFARKGPRTGFGRAQWAISRLRTAVGKHRMNPLFDFVNKWYPQRLVEKHWHGGVQRITSPPKSR